MIVALLIARRGGLFVFGLRRLYRGFRNYEILHVSLNHHQPEYTKTMNAHQDGYLSPIGTLVNGTHRLGFYAFGSLNLYRMSRA
jgi:hypothetical protein